MSDASVETSNNDDARNQIWLFVLLTLALSAIFYVLIIRGDGISQATQGYVIGLMWCPGLAGLVTHLVFRRSLRGLGWSWGRTRYQAMAYALPLFYCVVAYGAVWLLGLGRFYDEDVADQIVTMLEQRYGWAGLSQLSAIGAYFLLVATRGVALGCLSALGEEIGWRGLLVPQLARVSSFTNTALISGAFWAVWHWPLIFLAGYRGKGVVYSLVMFTIMAIAASFLFAWLRLRAGSLWTAVLLHASHNAFVQSFFDPITDDTGNTLYFTGEFGAALALVVGVLAWLAWRRRGELTFD